MGHWCGAEDIKAFLRSVVGDQGYWANIALGDNVVKVSTLHFRKWHVLRFRVGASRHCIYFMNRYIGELALREGYSLVELRRRRRGLVIYILVKLGYEAEYMRKLKEMANGD